MPLTAGAILAEIDDHKPPTQIATIANASLQYTTIIVSRLISLSIVGMSLTRSVPSHPSASS
jgi:hypothetical protein